MARPSFCVFVAASLDGFIARPDGGLDWLEPMQVPGEDHGFQAFFGAVDALAIGRKTYDFARGLPAWPYAGKRVVVLTHRPAPPRADETFFAGTPEALSALLEAEGARRVYLDGGAAVSAFLAAGLVDELTVSIVPVVLGDGIRLFQGPLPERRLVLQEARPHAGTGLVQLRYRVA